MIEIRFSICNSQYEKIIGVESRSAVSLYVPRSMSHVALSSSRCGSPPRSIAVDSFDRYSLSSKDYPNARKIIGQNSDKRTEYPTIRNPGFAHIETSERFIQSLELFSVTQQTSEHQTFPSTCIPSILNFEKFRKSAYYFGLKVCKEFQNEILGRLWSRVSK